MDFIKISSTQPVDSDHVILASKKHLRALYISSVQTFTEQMQELLNF